MVERRLPPSPSLPHEAPWRDVETIIGELKKVSGSLEQIAGSLQHIPFSGETSIAPDGRFRELIDKIDQFIYAVQTSPLTGESQLPNERLDTIIKNKPAWTHSHHLIDEAGKPKGFPDIPVPDGIALVVRALPGNTNDAYVGKSEAATKRNTERITLAAGEAVKLYVNNAMLVYGDAAVSGEGFEFFVEQDKS